MALTHTPSGQVVSVLALGDRLAQASSSAILKSGQLEVMRVVLLAGKKLRASKGKMVLVGLQDMVREVFEMSGFLALFAVAPTLEEGIAKV